MAPEDRHGQELLVQPRHHRVHLPARRRGRAEHRRSVRRQQLLLGAADDRDSKARFDRRDARRESRRVLHVSAGDGRRNASRNGRAHARLPGAGPAHRARHRSAQRVAVALRRAAIHGSRQARRSVARHGMAWASPGQHPAAQSGGAVARHRHLERFAENARRRPADAADRGSDELLRSADPARPRRRVSGSSRATTPAPTNPSALRR